MLSVLQGHMGKGQVGAYKGMLEPIEEALGKQKDQWREGSAPCRAVVLKVLSTMKRKRGDLQLPAAGVARGPLAGRVHCEAVVGP